LTAAPAFQELAALSTSSASVLRVVEKRDVLGSRRCTEIRPHARLLSTRFRGNRLGVDNQIDGRVASERIATASPPGAGRRPRPIEREAFMLGTSTKRQTIHAIGKTRGVDMSAPQGPSSDLAADIKIQWLKYRL
jgi:hypothetical protein